MSSSDFLLVGILFVTIALSPLYLCPLLSFCHSFKDIAPDYGKPLPFDVICAISKLLEIVSTFLLGPAVPRAG